LADIKLSANWMAAVAHQSEDAALYDAVRAVGMELCPTLEISIPVGKDSMSMQVRDGDREIVSPVSLIITAFARIDDVRAVWTPLLAVDAPSDLWHIDLSAGRARLGGSCLLQAWGRRGGEAPDLDQPERLRRLFALLAQARARDLVRAHHDVSDGGLLVALAEMAFASHCGLEIDLGHAGGNALAAAFAEEPGVVLQVRRSDRAAFERLAGAPRRVDLAAPPAVPIGQPAL